MTFSTASSTGSSPFRICSKRPDSRGRTWSLRPWARPSRRTSRPAGAAMVRRLVLVGPLGVFDEAEPVADVWAQRPGDLPGMVCADPARFQAAVAAPEGEDPIEAEVLLLRAHEAAARLLLALERHRAREAPAARIRGPVMLVWGEADRVVPFGYARRYADALGGGARIERVPGAGHLAELDAPDEVARRILAFLDD